MDPVVNKLEELNMVRSMMLAACAAALYATSSGASTISGDFSGTISNPNGTNTRPLITDGHDTDALHWGTAGWNVKTVDRSDASVLSVNAQSFNHTVSGSQAVLLGTISWVNHSNWYAGSTWDSVMTLDLGFDSQNGSVSQSLDVGFTAYNSTDETANTNLNEQTGNHADEIRGFYIDTSALNLPVALDGGIRVMDIFFQLDDAGTPGTETSFLHNGEAAASSYNETTGLWVNREGGSSTIGVYAEVSAVPLPAGLWLFMSGFGGFWWVKRATRRTA